MTRRFLVLHPRAAGAILSVLGVLLGAALVVACASALGGCGNIPQAIASTAATVDVAAERAIVGWLDDQAQQIEDDVAADGGGIEAWCAAMEKPHRTAQRVICAARALGDLALAGQEIIDTAGAGSEDWRDWLAALPPVVVALQDAFEAADYEPPAAVSRALRMLGALVDLVSGGDAADVPCEVTDNVDECAHLDDVEAP